MSHHVIINTLRPRQDGRHFADDIFKCIFFNKNIWIPIKISLKFVPTGPINNIPALVQIMAWRRPGDKPLSEPMLVSLLAHICITLPQLVKYMMTSLAEMFLAMKQGFLEYYVDLVSQWISTKKGWFFYSLWPGDTIWWKSSWTTLLQVIVTCSLQSHHLNHCWLNC